MNTIRAEAEQKSFKTRTGGGLYVTTDGVLRFCIIAPLLELPLDFKEWYTSGSDDGAGFASSELLDNQAA